MIKAILEMYAITKDEKYFSFADHFIDCKVMEDGSIEGYSVEELNIDNETQVRRCLNFMT